MCAGASKQTPDSTHILGTAPGPRAPGFETIPGSATESCK